MIEVTYVTGKQRRKLRIHEIPEKELSLYKLIGTASGADKNHCLYLANKYADNFEERVIGYRPAKPEKGSPVAISFYEKKEKKKKKAKS